MSRAGSSLGPDPVRAGGSGRPGLGRRLGVDQRLLLGLCAAMLVLIVAVSLLAPQSAESDPRPSTYNSGPQGAKAAFLLFGRLGRPARRWDRSLAELSTLDARRTTLLLAEPMYAAPDQKELAAELKHFLERGGRVLATGPSGALLLPGGTTQPPGLFQPGLCTTMPEGAGTLAQAGPVEMLDQGRWESDAAQIRVAQRCGNDAVVVTYAVGQNAPLQTGGRPGARAGAAAEPGEAIWWSSATPLTNAELKQDADLRLLLASVGPGRDVLFDESLHRETTSLWDEARGLPLGWLAAQAVGLFGLLVLSFSRRRGPVRAPVVRPRSSPLEFAESMGELYEKGGATSAATEAARRRLLGVITRDAGVMAPAGAEAGALRFSAPALDSATLQPAAAEQIAEALRERVGGDWSRVAEHLQAAARARATEISSRSALSLVQALHADTQAVQTAFAPAAKTVAEDRTAGTSQVVKASAEQNPGGRENRRDSVKPAGKERSRQVS